MTKREKKELQYVLRHIKNFELTSMPILIKDQEAESTIGLPTTLKITRIEQDKPKRQQLWLIR